MEKIDRKMIEARMAERAECNLAAREDAENKLCKILEHTIYDQIANWTGLSYPIVLNFMVPLNPNEVSQNFARREIFRILKKVGYTDITLSINPVVLDGINVEIVIHDPAIAEQREINDQRMSDMYHDHGNPSIFADIFSSFFGGGRR